jgi:dTDP-4-dehydrorhamnose reductase
MQAESSKKVLITGAAGQLGYELHQQLGTLSLPKTKDTLDIRNFDWVYQWLKASRPDAIINCAAYTNVAQAQRAPQDCWAVNVQGVNNLACCASHLDIPLVHISTDFVFGQDLACRRPYRESDPVAPLNVYGSSKAMGEHSLLRWAAIRDFPWWVIRCAGLFERPWRHKSNFPNAIQQSLECRAQRSLEVVSDVRTNLTYAPHLAKVIIWFLKQREQIASGIYHVTNRGDCSWLDAARRLAMTSDFRQKLCGVSRDVYAAKQGRDMCTMPRFTCLSSDRYEKLGGPKMPTWEEAIEDWSDAKQGSLSPV